jgi:hypothetical protein
MGNQIIMAWVLGVLLLAPLQHSFGAGMSDDEMLSLTADLLLIKFESGVNTCNHLDARNMVDLYNAMRTLSELRRALLPTATSKAIDQAKSSYRRGLAGLPVPDIKAADQVALICDRTLQKMLEVGPDSLIEMVQKGADKYRLMFAQSK